MKRQVHFALIDGGMLNYPGLSDLIARENYALYVVAPPYLEDLHRRVKEGKEKVDRLQDELSNLCGKMNVRDNENRDLDRQVAAMSGFIQCLKGVKACPSCLGGGCRQCKWAGWIGVEVEEQKS